ncbi:MAG: hypothetical protein SchgKO_19910 [Schleiferiaceae bacterium]
MKKILLLMAVMASVFSYSQPTHWGLTQSGGEQNLGSIFYKEVGDTSIHEVFSFSATAGSDAQYAISDTLGNVLGVTKTGGQHGLGIIYQNNPTTGDYDVLYHFDSTFYGSYSFQSLNDNEFIAATQSGGANGSGVIYRVNALNKTVEVLLNLPANHPQFAYGFVKMGGNQFMGFGINGECYLLDIASKTLQQYPITINFSSHPVFYQGKIYGGSSFGEIMTFNPVDTTVLVLIDKYTWSMNNLSVGPTPGTFLGVATRPNISRLFEFDLADTSYTELSGLGAATVGLEFPSPFINLSPTEVFMHSQYSFNGKFSIYNTTTNQFTLLLDYGYPNNPGFVTYNDKFFTLSFPDTGYFGNGYVVNYDYSTQTYTDSIVFSKSTIGRNPLGTMVRTDDGKFWGVCQEGGKYDLGTLWQYIPMTNELSVVFDFNDTINTPSGYLTVAPNGLIYGLTANGGPSSPEFGGLFSYDPSTDDFQPRAAAGFGTSRLYGKPEFGDNGYLFFCNGRHFVRFDPAMDQLTSLFTFQNYINGTFDYERGHITQVSPNVFVGVVTRSIAGQNHGYMYQFATGSQQMAKIHNFTVDSLGYYPVGKVLVLQDGNYYGATRDGGVNQAGILYSFNPTTTTIEKLVDFGVATNGQHPNGVISESSTGRIVGICESGGENGKGSVFEFDVATATMVVASFNSATGPGTPSGGLLEVSSIISVEEEEVLPKLELLVYPNPSSGRLTTLNPVDSRGTLRVLSSTGALLLEQSIDASEEVTLNNLPSGMLYLQIEAGGYLITRRVVIL